MCGPSSLVDWATLKNCRLLGIGRKALFPSFLLHLPVYRPTFSLSPFLPTMPVVTRESNASAHPGRIVQRVQRKKRTKQEIADDNAKAKAKAIAAKQEAANRQQAIISAIARLRASVEHEEEAIQARAHRPDLTYSSQAPNTTRTASTQELQVPVRAQECADITHDLESTG
jgi:hypothetical protein